MFLKRDIEFFMYFYVILRKGSAIHKNTYFYVILRKENTIHKIRIFM
jgi:hypothetical protein